MPSTSYQANLQWPKFLIHHENSLESEWSPHRQIAETNDQVNHDSRQRSESRRVEQI